VQVLTGHKALRCERQGGRRRWWWNTRAPSSASNSTQLLCAVGRVARLTGYGLEELGIPTNRTVETNEYLQTIYPNIYAAGDVAGPFQFTHTAAHQAWYRGGECLVRRLQEVQGRLLGDSPGPPSSTPRSRVSA
jgi:pyruvate/2-oxoglutarate dehydrogenase complex dihydrolipoamide dehydrogenase (E3) component